MAIRVKTTQQPQCAFTSRPLLCTGHLSEHAFSTAELMVAALLVALLATFSVPHLARWLSVIKVNAAARNLASELQLSRMRAISENTHYLIRFYTDTNTYLIQKEKDIPDQWEDVDPIRPLPAGIDLENVTKDHIYFQPLGTIDAGTRITLRNMQNHRRRIFISRSGRVKVERVP